MEGSKFLASLQKQANQGRALSERQFAVLARTVCECEGEDPELAALKARLAPYVPSGTAASPTDPAVPELVEMLGEITTWREPVKRGRRMFDDKEFADSLTGQFSRRKTLTPRQVAAMKKMIVSYREQIHDYAARAERLGLSAAPSGAKRRTGGKSRR